MELAAHAPAKRLVNQLVLLHPALAGAPLGDDVGAVVVAVAGEIVDAHLRIGQSGLDERLDFGGRHRHQSVPINWRFASMLFSSSAARTSASSTSQPALTRSPKTLRTTSLSPPSSNS